MVALHHRRPATVEQPTDETKRLRDGQPRRRVERALPVELGPVPGRPSSRVIGHGGVRPVRDRVRADAGLAIASSVEERRALRRADPFVEVAGVPGRPEPVEVERQHARRVGTVDQALDAPLGERRDEPLDREDERGRARDVAEEGKPSPVRDPLEQGVDHDVLGRDRERDLGDHDAGPVALGDMAQDVDRGVVLVVVGQELVAGRKPERAEDGVDGAGRVGDEGEVVRVSADERAEVAPGTGQETRQVAGKELDRLRLEPVAERPLDLEHRTRARPERSVVQERDRGVESPGGGVLGRHRQMMTGTLGPWVPWTRWIRSSSC